MTLEQAMADLTAASSSTDRLGQTVNIDGNDVICVKRDLTVEEATAVSSGLGVSVEGLRINVDKDLLQYQPVYNGAMVINGREHAVSRISASGNLLRITLVRYTT